MYQYSPLILAHFLHPQHVGVLTGVRVIEVGSVAAGKHMVFYLAFDPSNPDKIIQVRYQVFGCPSTIATASLLSELLLSLSIVELKKMNAKSLFERFMLDETRFSCAQMAASIIEKI